MIPELTRMNRVNTLTERLSKYITSVDGMYITGMNEV
jgi:hypothetical protein